MISVSSEKDLSNLILKTLRLRPVTNGRAFGKGYAAALEEGFLQVFALEKGIALSEDRGGFYRLHLWLASDSIEAELACLKQVLPKGRYVSEWAYRPQDLGMQTAIKALEAAGFRELLLRRRMELSKEALQNKNESPVMHSGSIVIRRAEPSDCSAVLALFRSAYDPLTGCLPKEKELLSGIESGLVLLAEKQGSLAAALHLEKSKSLLEIRHIAADKAFQRQGLGEALLDEAFAREDFQSCRLWTSPENLPACSLYRKKGFSWQDHFSGVLFLEI